jgi:hypothetical protein
MQAEKGYGFMGIPLAILSRAEALSGSPFSQRNISHNLLVIIEVKGGVPALSMVRSQTSPVEAISSAGM